MEIWWCQIWRIRSQVSSMVTYRQRNLAGSALYSSRLWLEVCIRTCMTSAVNILGSWHPACAYFLVAQHICYSMICCSRRQLQTLSNIPYGQSSIFQYHFLDRINVFLGTCVGWATRTMPVFSWLPTAVKCRVVRTNFAPIFSDFQSFFGHSGTNRSAT